MTSAEEWLNERDRYSELAAKNERLKAALRATADQIEKLAFDMPAPNDYTPQFVMLANVARAALEGK